MFPSRSHLTGHAAPFLVLTFFLVAAIPTFSQRKTLHRTQAAPTISAVLQYRSKQTGNWNDPNTWEQSTDGSTWVPAVAFPTSSDGTVTIQSGHHVSLT